MTKTKTAPALGQVRMIPLNTLVQSKKNVRTTRPRGIADLVASIPVHGLLHPLQVEPDANGCFEVVAGKRRLQALKALVKKKVIAATEPIPCRDVDPAMGLEVSLVENVGREDMHPADEFVAMKKLHDDGLPVEDIAARFGVTKTVVLQRLKLAAISPALMKRYRAGEMSLEILMAFTLTEDHVRQEEVWEHLPSWDRQPARIKRLLTEGDVSASDGRVVFVGLDAYEKAGGALRRDLFDENGAYLSDSVLLDRLAAEKLKGLGTEVEAEGWAWVETAVSRDYNYIHLHGRIHPKTVALSKTDQARLDQLAEQYDALAQSAAVGDDDPKALARLSALDAEIEALEAKTRQFTKAQMKNAGAYISVDRDGDLSIDRGLVKPEARKARGDDDEASETPAEQPKKAPKTHSDALLEHLTTHKTLALQAMVAASPDLAYDLLVAELVKGLYLSSPYNPRSCFLLTLERPPIELDEDLAEAPAHRAWVEQYQRWTLRLPQEASEVLGYVQKMRAEDKAELLALCLSASVDAVCRRKEGGTVHRYGYADQLAEALGLDMSQWWQASAVGYFEWVRKDVALDAVREAKGEAAADNLTKMKKADLARAAEDRVAGTGWLPEPFRVGARAPQAGETEASAEPTSDATAQAAE